MGWQYLWYSIYFRLFFKLKIYFEFQQYTIGVKSLRIFIFLKIILTSHLNLNVGLRSRMIINQQKLNNLHDDLLSDNWWTSLLNFIVPFFFLIRQYLLWKLYSHLRRSVQSRECHYLEVSTYSKPCVVMSFFCHCQNMLHEILLTL